MKNEALAPPTSPVNFFALLSVVLLGMDFLDLPYEAARNCGPSGYWPFLISICLAALPLVFLAILMQRRFPDQNLIVTATQVLGKPLAMIGNFILLGAYTLWLILTVRDSANLVLTYFLNRTPIWAVVVFFLLGIGYIVVNGLKPVIRLAAFVIIPAVTIRLMMQLFALQGLKTSLLLPLLSASPIHYLLGGLTMTNVFFPLSTIFLIYPLNQKPQKLHTAALCAVGIASLSFLLGIVGAIGTFGAELTQHFEWSEFAAVHHINVVFLVLEQVGLLFLVIWLSMFFVGVAFYFSIIAKSIQQQCSVFHYRPTCIVLIILVGVAVLFFFPNDFVSHTVFTVLRRWLILPVTVYPLFVYLMSILKGKREQPNEA